MGKLKVRILLVDDDQTFLKAIVPEIEKIVGQGNLNVCRSRDGAMSKLEYFFDVFILDLKIPTIDDALDESVAHGQAVFHQVQKFAPRTPVYFLTGSSADDVVTDLFRHAEKDDVWGERLPRPTVELVRKADFTDLLEMLKGVSECVEATEDIPINTGGQDLGLTAPQKRVLRVFARRREGAACFVAPLSGGLSGSRVLRITVRDAAGHPRIVAVGKVAPIASIDDEVRRFDSDVSRLKPGAFPQKVEVIRSGAQQTGGVFYRLLDDDQKALFGDLLHDDAGCAKVVARVQSLTEPWSYQVPISTKTVREIRRKFVKDETASQLFQQYNLENLRDIEDRQIQVRWCCSHGDLHGQNILVDRHLNPILIDFGDVGESTASTDPLTLELSLLFHPSRIADTAQQALQIAHLWPNSTEYAGQSPHREFILSCRNWAFQIAAGDREVYATAYAYLLRQLKYADTDKALAERLVAAVNSAFLRTYE